MGITGLLPMLKKASKNCNIRKFSGYTVAIDGYCWLHKGAFGCAEKLGKGEPTVAYITYCMKYIQVLLDNNIKPVVVLDGRNLPSKEHTEKKRREKRQENRMLARKHLQAGRRKEAWECFTKCVDITPEMARAFIKVLREKKIDYVVAPYEADSQLAYLARTGMVDMIITEDSDLVLFGCPKIFFKMNVNGDGVFFDKCKLPQCMGLTEAKFQFDRFRWMCILSGCDYLASIPGIGLGRAKKVIETSPQIDIKKIIMSIPSILEKVSVEIPDDYIDGFIQAENTFLYQLVFDTVTRTVVPLTPYPVTINPKDVGYAGSYQTKTIAHGLALGNIDLHTLETVDSYEPLKAGYTTSSIWSPSYHTSKAKHVNEKSQPCHTSTVGMELSISLGSSLKKKRPLSVTNPEPEQRMIEDDELLNMYSDIKPKIDEEFDIESDFKEPVVESPSANKRRRLTDPTKTDEISCESPSRNTRSQNRILPFRKTPENKMKIVKSGYFRKEVKPEPVIEKKTISQEVAMADKTLAKLNIYSYDNSQQSLSDASISQNSFDNSPPEDSPLSNHEPFSKTSSSGYGEEIVDSVEEDDCQILTDQTCTKSPIFRSTSGLRSASTSPSLLSFAPPKATKRSVPVPCRRLGLSKSIKKDPRQLSVKDMFSRQQSKY